MLILLVWAILTLVSCGGRPASLPPPPYVESVSPQNVAPGEIQVFGGNFLAGSKVRVNGEKFPTTYTGPGALKADIAGFLAPEPGRYSISVESPEGVLSNSIELSVLPRDPVPIVKEIYPRSIRAGIPFNVQPNGRSAFSLVGANFLPDAVIEVEGQPLLTVVADRSAMSAFLDEEFFAKPGRLKIIVRNKDGKVSLPVELPVNP